MTHCVLFVPLLFLILSFAFAPSSLSANAKVIDELNIECRANGTTSMLSALHNGNMDCKVATRNDEFANCPTWPYPADKEWSTIFSNELFAQEAHIARISRSQPGGDLIISETDRNGFKHFVITTRNGFHGITIAETFSLYESWVSYDKNQQSFIYNECGAVSQSRRAITTRWHNDDLEALLFNNLTDYRNQLCTWLRTGEGAKPVLDLRPLLRRRYLSDLVRLDN